LAPLADVRVEAAVRTCRGEGPDTAPCLGDRRAAATDAPADRGPGPEEPELSPRELAVRFTDTQRYFVSEASVYRLMKACDLVTSPAFAIIKAADEFHEKTPSLAQQISPRASKFWESKRTENAEGRCDWRGNLLLLPKS
jgi:hypothetical protein